VFSAIVPFVSEPDDERVNSQEHVPSGISPRPVVVKMWSSPRLGELYTNSTAFEYGSLAIAARTASGAS